MAQQTQAQQVTKIVEDLTSLRKEYVNFMETQHAKLVQQVMRIEEKMKTYEEKQKESTAILKDVQETISNYDATLGAILRMARYTLYSIFTLSGGIAVIVIANWLLAILHIHP